MHARNQVRLCKLVIVAFAVVQCCSICSGNGATSKSHTVLARGELNDEFTNDASDVLEPGKLAVGVERETLEESNSFLTMDQNKRSVQLVKQAVRQIRAQ